MSTLLKLSSAKSAPRNIRINVMEQEDGKLGYPVYINENHGGVAMPGHRGTLFINESGASRWMTISAPLRRKNEDGSFALMSRTNEEGQLLDRNGAVVANPNDAAQVYEYIRDKSGNVVFGTIATINVQNTNSKNEPTKTTLMNVKIFDDNQALEIERKVYMMKRAEGDKRKTIENEIRDIRKNSGEYLTLFINDGANFLRQKGFEVRLIERDANHGQSF